MYVYVSLWYLFSYCDASLFLYMYMFLNMYMYSFQLSLVDRKP